MTPPRSAASETLAHAYQVLGSLMTVNTNLGRAVQRFFEHQDKHGTMPASDLRDVAHVLHDVADQMIRHADELDRPVFDGD